jgi:LysR family transcriptional regulator for bpeEF and oprC
VKTKSNFFIHLFSIMSLKSLSNILAFARVAETNSFAQASYVLGLSTSAVSKAIARLEADLGMKLLHRTTRSLSLTPDGVRFYEGCQRLLVELNALEAEMQENIATPKGRLVISTTAAFGRLCLMPILEEFTSQFSEITIDVSFDDRAVDLAEEGVDIAIRTSAGLLEDSTHIIARRLLKYPLVTCGTPAYLARYGKPQHPRDLDCHNCLNFRNRTTGRLFPWFFSIEGKQEQHFVSGSAIFDDNEAVLRAAMAGIGLGQVPAFMVAEAFQSGAIEEVLPSYRPLEFPIWICYLDRRFVSKRIRTFVDFIHSKVETLRTTG